MVYGCFHGAFLDNPKYLFFYANEHYPQYEHIWLSTRRDTVENVRQLGYRAYWTYSLKGFYYLVRIVQDPAVNGRKYYMEVSQNFDKALKLNPEINNYYNERNLLKNIFIVSNLKQLNNS